MSTNPRPIGRREAENVSKPRKSAPATDAPTQSVAAPPELAPEAVASPEPVPVIEDPSTRPLSPLEAFFSQAHANLEIAAADPRVARIEAAIATAVQANVPAHELFAMRRTLLHTKAEAAFPIRADCFTERHVRDLANNGIHLNPEPKPAA